MRVLCVTDSLSSGGAQRQLVNLAVGFAESGLDVTFLVYHDLPFYKSELDKNEIRIVCLKENIFLLRIARIRKFIRTNHFSAVISFLDSPNFICTLSALPYKKWKLILGERSSKPLKYTPIKVLIFRFLYAISDHVITNSYANLELIKKTNPILPSHKCKVIYNIVDQSIWIPSKEYVPKINGKLKLVVVASHRFLKNLNGLVDALMLLDKHTLDTFLIEWYGDSITEPYYDNSYLIAKTKIVNYNLDAVITFFPAQREILPIIQLADAIGLFSFYEGLPNIICEAMSCAKPVICTNISDMPDLFTHDSSLLCDPESAVSIARGLNNLALLSNAQLVQIGKKNRSVAMEKFDKRKNIESFLKLLK